VSWIAGGAREEIPKRISTADTTQRGLKLTVIIEVMRSSQTGGAELNFGSRLISGISQDIKFKRSVKSFGLGGGWKEGDGLEPPSTTPCPPDTISGCKTPL